VVTDNTSQLSRLFDVYLQVGNLHRSLSFLRDDRLCGHRGRTRRGEGGEPGRNLAALGRLQR
jgi:hypothetical protein